MRSIVRIAAWLFYVAAATPTLFAAEAGVLSLTAHLPCGATCWCRDDYCPKPAPCVPCVPMGHQDCHCRKPLPPVPHCACLGCDDYVAKTCPNLCWWRRALPYTCGTMGRACEK